MFKKKKVILESQIEACKFWKEVRMEQNDTKKFKSLHPTTSMEKGPQLKLADLRKARLLKASMCVT